MKFPTKWLVLVGVVMFLIILGKVGPIKIIDILKETNLVLIFLALVTTIPIILIKALKWFLIVRAHGEAISFWKTTKIWLIGIFGETVTPGRIGTVLRAFYFKNIPKAMSAAIIDKVIEVIVLLGMGCIGTLLVVFWFGSDMYSLFTILLLLAFIPFLIYAASKRSLMRKLTNPIFELLVPEKYKSQIRLSFDEFYTYLENFLACQKKILLISMLLSFVAWVITIYVFVLLSSSLGLNINYFHLFAFIPLAEIMQLVPITISGFGIRETAFIFLMGLISISAASAVSLALLAWVIGIAFQALLGLILFTSDPMKISS